MSFCFHDLVVGCPLLLGSLAMATFYPSCLITAVLVDESLIHPLHRQVQQQNEELSNTRSNSLGTMFLATASTDRSISSAPMQKTSYALSVLVTNAETIDPLVLDLKAMCTSPEHDGTVYSEIKRGYPITTTCILTCQFLSSSSNEGVISKVESYETNVRALLREDPANHNITHYHVSASSDRSNAYPFETLDYEPQQTALESLLQSATTIPQAMRIIPAWQNIITLINTDIVHIPIPEPILFVIALQETNEYYREHGYDQDIDYTDYGDLGLSRPIEELYPTSRNDGNSTNQVLEDNNP